MSRHNHRRRHRPRRQAMPARPTVAAISPYQLHLRRQLITLAEPWEICGRESCFRASACRVTTTPCFDKEFDTVRGVMWEWIYDVCPLLDFDGEDLMELGDQVDRAAEARDEAADAAEVDAWLRELGKA